MPRPRHSPRLPHRFRAGCPTAPDWGGTLNAESSPRILILHATAGSGHRRAAQALEAAFRELEPRAHVRTLDTLHFGSRLFRSGYTPTYDTLVGRVPRVWGLPVERYLAATSAPGGWGWLGLAGRGDFANFVGIGLLALVTVLCYLRVLVALLAAGRTRYALLAAAQVLVLLAAASGVLSSAH